jgi:aminopeptidase N
VASYLTTIAIGDYRPVSATGPDGLPLTYWVLPGQDKYLDQLRQSPRMIEWLTERLGPFPFPTAGVVLVPTHSAMETQETVTMGAGGSASEFRANLLHEYSHQWYGDMVTPSDWSDMWLNESFAMYLQLEWMTDVGMTTTNQWVTTLREADQELRRENGPPGAYDEEDFASANVYYCGALMLHELGRRIGEEELDTLLREWPQRHSYANADRDDWIEFVEDETGRRLEPFVLDWLLSERTPPS